MKELSVREIQLGELGVLKKLASLCEEQGLRYFIFYGTLIGAARHQGFIPWDDDIDIVMPRPDYERLLEYLLSHEKELEPFKLMSYRNNDDYIYPISRFCDTRYMIEYDGATDYGLGLFVDIYPFDGCGNSDSEVKEITKENVRLIDYAFQVGQSKFTASNTAPWRTPFKFVMYVYAKLLGKQRIMKRIEKNSMSHSFEKDTFCNCTVWDHVDYYFRRDMFDSFTYLPFEDSRFRVPENYDEVLRTCYGDYMQLPPEEDRVGHHYYKAYLKNVEN